MEQDALDLTHAFNDSTFKGYALLNCQRRSRTTALQPPVSDFTEHYRAHYQLGDEEPLELQSCELPPSASDDIRRVTNWMQESANSIQTEHLGRTMLRLNILSMAAQFCCGGHLCS